MNQQAGGLYGFTQENAKASLNRGIQGYKKAIERYSALRDRFAGLMVPLQQEIGQNLAQKYAQTVNEQLSNVSSHELMSQNNLSLLRMRLVQLSDNILSGQAPTGDIKKIITDGYSRLSKTTISQGKSNPDLVINRLRENLRSKLNSALNSIEQTYLQQIYREAFGEQAVARTASINALYSVIRKQLITRILYSNNIAALDPGYARVFRGDFWESWGEQAINAAYEGTAAQTGAILTSTGKQSKYDFVIGPGAKNTATQQLQKILNDLEKLDRQITIDTNLLGNVDYDYMGGQAKSWSIPQSSKINKNNFLDVGKHTDLWMNKGFNQDKPTYRRGWHYSVQILGENIFEVLGAQQAFYILAGQFIWTSDLIQSLMEQKYYLSFYFAHPLGEGKYLYGPDNTEAGQVVWARQKLKLGRRVKKS